MIRDVHQIYVFSKVHVSEKWAVDLNRLASKENL